MTRPDPEIILLGSFGRSGMGAINNLLAPHPDIFATPYEQRLLTDPDGLLSLEMALTENWTAWQADFAISRFRDLTRNLGPKWAGTYVKSGYRKRFGPEFEEAVGTFLDRLVTFSYRGVWAARATFPNKALLRLTKPRRYFFNSEEIFFAPSISPEEFSELAREFIRHLYRGVAAAKGATRVVVNEPFVSQNAARCLRLTGSRKLIIVSRDPRDSFASFMTRDWSPQELPQAVEFQRCAQQRWLQQRSELPADQYMEIKLEDLVTDLATAVRKLEEFLEIEITPEVMAQSQFTPERAHVGRWRKQFSPEERTQINDAFAEILRAYGYE